MSGGVDSSVAALLLKEQGYSVVGAYIKTWLNEEDVFAHCPWQDEIEDARTVAEIIGIEFKVINLIGDYRESVVQYLIEGYRNGLTPNPDVICNRDIKFGSFLKAARAESFEGVATGHYCRRIVNRDESCDLWEGADKNKDQSYFLALISQHQLRHALFPLGDLNKRTVRQIAHENSLPTADKKDSQGICFLGKVRIANFLENFIPDQRGEIVDIGGRVLGNHRGLHRYTLGQRKGIRIPSNTDSEAYVVVAKDLERNRLTVAFDRSSSPGLYRRDCLLRSINFLNEAVSESRRLLAKPRYRDPSSTVVYTPLKNGTAKIVFDQPQRALAPGQVCALYDGEKLLGGGIYQ